MKHLIFIPYVLLFGSLGIVGCASNTFRTVDTRPVQQSLSTIDDAFTKIEREKSRKQIAAVAESGRKEVAVAQQKLALVQTDADKLKGDRDWAYDQIKVRDGWLEEAKHTIADKDVVIKKRDSKLDKLGLMLAGASACLVFMLLGCLTPFLTPAFAVYALAGRLVVSAMVFAAVFGWVRYL